MKSSNYNFSDDDADDQVRKNQKLFDVVRSEKSEDEKIIVIKDFIANGAEVNFKDANRGNNTSLHFAVHRKELKIINLLLEFGAKTDEKNNKNQTPEDLAENKEIIDAISLNSSLHQKRISVDSTEIVPKKLKISTQASGVLKKSHHEEEFSQAKRQRTDEEYSKGGLVHSLHGNIYQLKLLMLFLKRGVDKEYSFRLATEWDEAEKFDDLVFEYTEGDKTVYRFLQAKHKQNDSKNISLNDLLTETDGEFSLQKYFISYRKIKENSEFTSENIVIKDFVICTNIDLINDLHDSFESVKGTDDILHNDPKKNCKRLKLKFDSFSKKKKLTSILKNTSDLNKLAKELAQHVIKEKQINFKNPLFKTYHGALVQEKIILTQSQKFHDDFVGGQNLSPSAEKFRRFFEEEALKLKKDSRIFVQIKGQKLNLSAGFGEIFELNTNPQITNTKDFAEAIVGSIMSPNDKVVSILKNQNIIKDNIDKLAGHILIYEGDDQNIKFRSSFLDVSDTSLQGIGNLQEFKDNLLRELKCKSIEFALLVQYEFKINKFKTCEDGQQYLQNTLPTDDVKDSEIGDFFEKLVFAVNQPNEQDLGQIIKKELGREFNNIDTKNVYSRFQKKMLNWMKEKKGHFFSYENGKQFFEKVKKETLGAIWFDVKDPVALFTGREQELKELNDIIQNDSGGRTVISQIKSISGLGGIGKTELARKYVYDYGMENYDSVVWIDAESEITLKNSFIRLAEGKLGISTKTKDDRQKDTKSIIEEVYKFIQKGKSLFVFDNAENHEYLNEFLPIRSLQSDIRKPNILITSRNREWDEGIKVISVFELKMDDAIEFVRKGLNISPNYKMQDTEIESLVKKLQCFPLALQQAISYIKYHRKTGNFKIKNYIEEFEMKAELLLQSNKFKGIDNDYAKTTYTTWKITVDEIRNEESGGLAIKILNLIAYYAPERINREIFLNLLSVDEEQLKSAVRLLVKYSMVNGEEMQSILNIHRLVQQVTRINLKVHKEEENIFVVSLKLLQDNFPFGKDKSEDFIKKRQLLPHLEAFLSHLDTFTAEKPECKQKIEEVYHECMLSLMSDGYFDLGNFMRQKELLERALKIQEKQYDRENFKIKVANTLRNLSIAHRGLGNHQKQRELLERALAIIKKFYGSDHPKVANFLLYLSNTYEDVSDHQKQKELLEQALEINQKHYGVDNIEVADVLHNLGNVYGYLYNYDKQKEMLERALAINQKEYGVEHFKVADALHNLGTVYGNLGDHQKKKDSLERAIKINQKLYGLEHLRVADSIHNLSNVYGHLGDHHKKKELLERVLAINQQHFGPEHFKVAGTLHNLSIAYRDLGDYQKQKELLEQALEINQKHYGGEHFKVAETLLNLSSVYGNSGDHEKKKEMLERAILINQKHFGLEHFKVAEALHNLSNAYRDLGDHHKQKELLERVLAIDQKHYGLEHFKVADALLNLSYVYKDLGDHQKEKELLERVLEINQKNYHPEHVKITGTIALIFKISDDIQKQKEM